MTEPTPEPAPAPEPVHEPAAAPAPRGGRPVLTALVALLVGAVGASLWINSWPSEPAPQIARQFGSIARVVGDSTKMAADFADADGDLIPDAPAESVDPTPLVFAGPPSVDPTTMQAGYEPLRAHLEKELGRPVEYFAATYPDELIDALKERKLHAAYFPTGAVPRAVNLGGFVPVASPADAAGKSEYRPLLVAPARGADAPTAVKGKVLAGVNVASFSGYKSPVLKLRGEFHLVPGVDYDIRWTGSHLASIRGVASGLYPLAGVASNEFEMAKAKKLFDAAKVKVIATGGPQPIDAVGYSHALKPELAAKVRAALLSFAWEGTATADYYKGTGYVKFAPVDYKSAWADVRKADEELAQWDAGN